MSDYAQNKLYKVTQLFIHIWRGFFALMMPPFYFLLHFLALDPLTRPRLRMHSGHNTIYSAASNVSLLKALKVTNCTVFSSLEGRRPVSFITQKNSMALQTLPTMRVREFSESQFFGNWLSLLVTLVLNYIQQFQQASNWPFQLPCCINWHIHD